MDEVKRALELMAGRNEMLWQAERALLRRVVYEHIDDGVVQATSRELARAVIVFNTALRAPEHPEQEHFAVYAYECANTAIGPFREQLKLALDWFDRDRDRDTDEKHILHLGRSWVG